jgi:hypothetical protein
MPPWLDWFDYFGADAVGKLMGLWLRFWFSLPGRLFRFLTGTARNPRRCELPVLTRDQLNKPGIPFPMEPSPHGQVRRIIISTLLTLTMWRAITWKPFWTAAGPRGDRILAAILLLVTASWLISLVWICCSKSRRKGTGVAPIPRSKRRTSGQIAQRRAEPR